MGVPKFFRYISERYPCLSEVVKEDQIPVFDNLYLDMNGIIHMCSHPDDGDAHFRITEEKIFVDVFHYIEVLFRMIKPRKLFFMAVDGVAPRAKMNQQRGRRFRSAKEALTLEAKALERGETLPFEARFDSNCITPGTAFMVRLHEQLKYFVVNKISNDKLWQKCTVILSGHETPGEGEHKIMDYIRYMRAQPGYDPNTRHCLYGLDADLIMLGLCTHEPHFSLLREEVRFGKKSNKRKNIPEQITFFLLHLSLMREYLELEFSPIKNTLSFEYNMEKVIDDWVLMGFLVGNDFIPNLPNMHIDNGALPILYNAYMKVLPKLNGYINENGILNLERFEIFIQELSAIDIDNFTEKYADLKWFEAKTGRRFNEKSNDSKSEIEKLEDDEVLVENSDLANLIKATEDILLDPSLCAEDSDVDNFSEMTDNEDDLFQAEFVQHKTDYYMNKLEYENVTEEVLKSQAEEYVRAIQWNLHYYYNGVCSWSWFYPHHYAPYISDIKNFANLSFHFELGKPFKPYEQLLAVLPAASRLLLPEPYRSLMTDENSLIKEYYPEDFRTDLNGKKQEWEAVVLVPFIDEHILLKAMEPGNQTLSEEEKQRNTHEPMLVYEFTDEKMNKYSAPDYFPTIEVPHAKCTHVSIEDIRVPIEELVKGAYPGALFDVYYPGFPTMKHLKYTGHLEKIKVRVFEQPSRYETMVLSIISDDNLLTPDALAKEMLGKTAFVGWPHLTEALVVSVSCSDYKYNNIGEVGQYNVEESTKTVKSKWDMQRESVTDYNLTRMGIDVGAIEVIIHAKLLTGQKYVITHGRISLEKQFSNVISAFPLQAIVRNIAVHEEVYTSYKSVRDIFPIGAQCFMLGQPCYGLLGEVLDSEESLKSGRLKVSIKKYEEPDLSSVIQLDNSLNIRFISIHVASTRLAISKKLFGRITGCVYLVPKRSFETESDDVKKTNIGLNLKFNKKNEEVPGYTRKEGNTWLYSEKAIALVSAYMQEFPMVFEYLNFHVGKEVFVEDDMFPNGEAQVQIKRIIAWIKNQPFYSIERQVCGSSTVDPEAIQMLEKVVDDFNLNSSKYKEIVMQVKPHLLYKNSIQMGNLMPDPLTTFQLYDRVVNVLEGYTVPMGFKGTIIGIHKSATQNDAGSSTFDVLFDQEFVGAVSINTSSNRSYRMPKTSLINISHGTRALEQKSGKPGQLQNMQNQSQQKHFNNGNGLLDNTLFGPSQYQPLKWSQGCNFYSRSNAPPAFPNFNQFNFSHAQNFNGSFPNPSTFPSYINNYKQIPSGQRSFTPYKNNAVFQSNTPQTSQYVTNNLNTVHEAMLRDYPKRKENDEPKEVFFKDRLIPTQVIKSSKTKMSDGGNEKSDEIISSAAFVNSNFKSDKGSVLTPEDIFAHARTKTHSPLAKVPGVDHSNKESFYTTRLPTEFQVRGLGIPNYEYFTINNSIVAKIKLPDGSAIIGEAAESQNEAAENAAFATLRSFDKQEPKQTPSFSSIPQPPTNSVPPRPPTQWHSSQKLGRRSKENEAWENWRTERLEGSPQAPGPRSSQQRYKCDSNVDNASKAYYDSCTPQKKNLGFCNVSNSPFVPLQAILPKRNKSSTDTHAASKTNEHSDAKTGSIQQKVPAAAASGKANNNTTKSRFVRKRKVAIAANFQHDLKLT